MLRKGFDLLRKSKDYRTFVRRRLRFARLWTFLALCQYVRFLLNNRLSLYFNRYIHLYDPFASAAGGTGSTVDQRRHEDDHGYGAHR